MVEKINKVLIKRTKSGRPRKVRRDKGKKRSIAEQVKDMKLRKYQEVKDGK